MAIKKYADGFSFLFAPITDWKFYGSVTVVLDNVSYTNRSLPLTLFDVAFQSANATVIISNTCVTGALVNSTQTTSTAIVNVSVPAWCAWAEQKLSITSSTKVNLTIGPLPETLRSLVVTKANALSIVGPSRSAAAPLLSITASSAEAEGSRHLHHHHRYRYRHL